MTSPSPSRHFSSHWKEAVVTYCHILMVHRFVQLCFGQICIFHICSETVRRPLEERGRGEREKTRKLLLVPPCLIFPSSRWRRRCPSSTAAPFFIFPRHWKLIGRFRNPFFVFCLLRRPIFPTNPVKTGRGAARTGQRRPGERGRRRQRKPKLSSWQRLKQQGAPKPRTVSTPFQSSVVCYDIITDVIKTFFNSHIMKRYIPIYEYIFVCLCRYLDDYILSYRKLWCWPFSSVFWEHIST